MRLIDLFVVSRSRPVRVPFWLRLPLLMVALSCFANVGKSGWLLIPMTLACFIWLNLEEHQHRFDQQQFLRQHPEGGTDA